MGGRTINELGGFMWAWGFSVVNGVMDFVG